MEQKSDFISRFAEACGTAESLKISKLLSISNQTARNYLAGRLPRLEILVRLADRTPYSLHWLLTGNGERHAATLAVDEEERAERLVRRVLVEVVEELASGTGIARRSRLRLHSDEIITESAGSVVLHSVNSTD